MFSLIVATLGLGYCGIRVACFLSFRFNWSVNFELQLDSVRNLILLDCFSVKFRHGERIAFSYLISQKHTGDDALVKVLRNSEMLEFNIKLGTHRRLIPAHIKGRPPSYYIVAGFVFTAVSVPYLRSEVSS